MIDTSRFAQSLCDFYRRLFGQSNTTPISSCEEVADRDALERHKKQLELEMERTLWRFGYELQRLGREAENLKSRTPDNELYVASDSPVLRMMNHEIPDLRNKLSKAIAGIDGIDYLQARAKVHAWQRPMFNRLVRRRLRELAGVKIRMVESDDPMVDAYEPEDN